MASKQQAYRGNDKKGWPAWAWLGIGVVLGIVVASLALVRDWAPLLRKSNLPQPNAQAVAPKASDQAVADAAKTPPPKKTFDFYSVLPEMEVVIPDAELSAKAKAEQARQALAASQAQAQPAGGSTSAAAAPTPPIPAEPGGGYMLLAGSYADARTADEAKAKLALLGLVAKVQPVTIDGKTWNRILLGPYADASATEAAKKTLADNGVKAIPMKKAAGP